MKRPARIALIAAATLVAAGAAAIGVALSQFDPNAYKPEIVAAVKRATGRDLALNGDIGLKFSLSPTIQASDVTFSNPPGLSRPNMATLQAIEVRFALLPLLSRTFQVDRILLVRPDILLETDAAGQPNWRMAPQAAPASPAAPSQPAPSGQRTRMEVSVDTVRIENGTLAYRDDATGTVTTLAVAQLDASAASADSPVHLEAEATYNGAVFGLIADTGGIARLQDPAATAPWPVKLAFSTGAAKLGAEGTIARPLQGKGYVLAVNGNVPDLSALTPFLQGRALPALRDVTFAASAADKGGAISDITALKLHAGASDLGAQAQGLTLASLDIDAPAAETALKAAASGQFDNAPLSLNATLGGFGAFLPDAKPAPFPVDVTVQAAGGTLHAQGAIADAKAMTGASLAVDAAIPDLSALSPLARRPLPAVKQIAFKASVTDAPGGFRNGAAIAAMTLATADGDLAGNLSVGLRPRMALDAVLKSTRLDLDALRQAAPPAETQSAAPPAETQSAAPPPGAGAHGNAPQARKRDGHLFSRQAIPFGQLRETDGDVTIDIAALRAGGADAKAVSLHAGLKDGKLAVDRIAAELPAGRMTGSLTADASQAAPPVHVALHAPGLALKAILEAAREPSVANGTIEVNADLSGAGNSPHDIAGSLDGSLGIAMAGGTIDNRLLGSILGRVMDSINALDLVGKGGTSELRCFAVRMEARHGDAAVQPLVLNSSLLTMTGSGSVNLGEETLAMTLRPQVRMGGTGLVVPLKLSGPVRNPAVSIDRAGAAETNIGSVAGALAGNATPIGALAGVLGADKLLGGKSGDGCAPALAAARGQPAPAEAAPAKAAEPGLGNAGAVLKNLFR